MYGSVAYRDEAETYWREFEATLHDLKQATDALEAQLAIFVSPLVFDIDSTGRHAHFNEQRLDFACATIAPRDRLSRIAERNFTPFFSAADDNHFNQVAAGTSPSTSPERSCVCCVHTELPTGAKMCSQRAERIEGK